MFTILGTIVVGLIVGLIARAVKPGDDKLGWIMTIVLGVAGSFLARYVGVAMGWEVAEGPEVETEAIVLLFIYGLVKKKA